jgi:hypothetical protein
MKLIMFNTNYKLCYKKEYEIKHKIKKKYELGPTKDNIDTI